MPSGKELLRPYVHLSPQYMQAYEKAVREDFEGQTVVAAMDFAENYFGKNRYFYWGFMVFSDYAYSRYYNEHDEDEPKTYPLSYDKVGVRWRSWFGEEYKDYRWVEPGEIAPPDQPIEFDCAAHNWDYHLGEILNWRDPQVECQGETIFLSELRIVRGRPEVAEYFLTLREGDGFLAQTLFYALDTWKHLEKAHEARWISDKGFASISKKFWVWMDQRLREHEAHQAWLASLGATEHPEASPP